jgi:dTMP kinase
MPQPVEFLSEAIPGFPASGLRGKLIALEGPAAVGRSTQATVMREFLEDDGYSAIAIQSPPWKGERSIDSARALREFAAFAEQLELEIIPALRKGFWVLADGYVFSLAARMEARGLARDWLRRMAGFALMPHAVIYLRAEPQVLMNRVAARGGFGYEQSAMDLRLGADRCESFLRYQERVLSALDGLADEYGFPRIDANRPVEQVCRQTLRELRKLQ